MQKIVPRTRVISFRYERTRCTPWDTKHETHVLLHFVMFGCIWDGFVTALNSMQTGQSGTINAKDHATNLRRIFFAMKAPDRHHGTQNSCFYAFRNV